MRQARGPGACGREALSARVWIQRLDSELAQYDPAAQELSLRARERSRRPRRHASGELDAPLCGLSGVDAAAAGDVAPDRSVRERGREGRRLDGGRLPER